ncbi:MAG: hypothetical protein WCT52_05665 [Candidatus Micrarchaeia archaeon]
MMANAGGRRNLAFALFVAAAMLLLSFSGCATSSKYVPCCKRDNIFNVSTNPQVLLAQPNCTFSDGARYGPCDANSTGDGTIRCLPDAVQCNKPITQCTKTIGCVWEGTSASGACRPLQCGDLADNKSCTAARCLWDGANCAPSSAAAYVTMSICVDAAPSSCTNEKCSVMLCGYKKLVPAPPVSSSDWNDGTSQPAAAANQPEAINLLGTSCTFKKMTEKTYNSVRNSRGALWANAFRFGVGSSFLDFEAARFFFPLSDRFCAGVVAPSARDRFVTYVNAQTTWCAPQNTNVVTCTENRQDFTDLETCKAYCRDSANCQNLGATGFLCLETGMVYSNNTTCRSDCGIVEDPKSCSLDPAKYPFLESDSRYMMSNDGSWKLNYTYYQETLESQYGMGLDRLYDYECETSGDCMSGYCDHTSHIRGLCINATDTLRRIDCGCRAQQVESGTILNCSNALSGYTIYRSVIAANLKGRSTGTTFETAGGAQLFNPYDDSSNIRDNEIQKVEGGILFSQGTGGNIGNVGSQDNKTYRFYVLADGQTEPPKLFKNCGISRTSKNAIYSAYLNGASSPFKGSGTVPGSSDGYGPDAAPMCMYSFQKHDVVCGGDDTNQYMDALLPSFDGCTLYLDRGDRWPGTGNTHCVTCWTGKYCYSYTGTSYGAPHDYWIYELAFDEDSQQLGECSLIGDRVPYINAKDIGWCEGCTYSTLAPQTVSDSNYDEIADKVNARAPLYMQSNIMPVIDIRNMSISHYHAANPYCASGYYNWDWDRYTLEYVCDTYDYIYDDWTNFNGLGLCQNNSGAALYIVSDLTKIGDYSAPAASKGSANAVADPVTSTESMFVPYLTVSNAAPSGVSDATSPDYNAVYLNGYSASLWKSQILKSGCPNAPLTAIFLNGFSSREITSNPAQLSALIGNYTSPGILFNFFYRLSMPAFKEAPVEMRAQAGAVDYYANNVDILAQEWYPMCNAGDNTAANEFATSEATKIEFEARMNFSRALASNFSKPSLVTKFHFPSGSLCNQSEFLEYMFRHKGDMVDAGIMGLIYDNWNNTSTGGYLDNPVDMLTGKVGTPFCAVQNHSKLVMGLSTLTYGQKIVAENQTCICQPCDTAAYSTGVCDRQIAQDGSLPMTSVPYLMCNDGQYCTMPDPSFTNYSRYFCAPLCANISAADLCSDLTDANLSCRIDTIYRSYRTLKNFTDLNDKYWNLIAALPAQDKCFLEMSVANETQTYTYLKKQSVTQRSELLQYPRRGDIGIDCGRTPDTSFLTYCGIDVPLNQEETTCFRVEG